MCPNQWATLKRLIYQSSKPLGIDVIFPKSPTGEGRWQRTNELSLQQKPPKWTSLKVFNAITHLGNTNQNCLEILSHPARMGVIKKTKDNKFWEDVGEGRVLINGPFKGVNMQTGTFTVEVSVEVSQEVKNRFTIQPATVLLGIIPRIFVPHKRNACISMFMAVVHNR